MAKVHASRDNLVASETSAMHRFELAHPDVQRFLNKTLQLKTWLVVLVTLCVVLLFIIVGLSVHYGAVAAYAPSGDKHKHTPTPTPTPATQPPSLMQTTGKLERNVTADLLYRIPRDFLASKYTMYILPNMSSSEPAEFSYFARSTIHLTCVQPSNRIVLHANSDPDGASISVNAASVALYTAEEWSRRQREDTCQMWLSNNANANVNAIRLRGPVLYVAQYEYVVLTFEQTLLPGNYVLQLAWRAPITKALRGFYYSSYKGADGSSKYLALTHFSSVHARRAFPCIDEPDVKATFNIRLVNYMQSTLTTLANTPLSNSLICEADGVRYRMDVYEPTVASSTYQIAYTFSNYDNRSTVDTKGRVHRVFTRPEKISLVDYAVSLSPKLVQYFEQLFAIDYDYAKLDHFSVPDFAAGAMENWGLIIYHDDYLWYNESADPISQQQRVAIVLSHEIAHMWFGNLVTITWFDDLWITEGWASYCHYLGVDAVHPEWNIMQRYYVDTHWYAMNADSSNSSRPLSFPVKSNAQVHDMFDTITYDKGAAVMHMVRGWLGNDTFWRAVRLYLRRYSYGNSKPEYLANVLDEVAQIDGLKLNVSAVLLPWVYQGGYPVVKLSLFSEVAATYVAVEQRRFLLDGTVDNRTLWTIPLQLWSSDGTKANFLITQRTQRVKFGDTGFCIVGNNLMSAYYRVNYDNANWQCLTRLLASQLNTVDAVNRGMLVEDAFNLARSGDISYDVMLNLTSYMANEFDFLPWSAAISNLDYLERMLWNSQSDYTALATHWLSLIMPVYSSLGWRALENETTIRRLLRVKVIEKACSLDLPDCVNAATEAYSNWTSNPLQYPLTADLKSAILCTAIRNGAASDWYSLYGTYINASDDRRPFIIALGCSNNVTLLQNWLLSAYNDSSVPNIDFFFIYYAVSRNVRAKQMCRSFFYDNWQRLFQQPSSTSYLGTIISNIFDTANTQSELDTLVSFVAKFNKELSFVKVPLEQAIEDIKSNMKFLATRLVSLSNWIRLNSPRTSAA